MIGGDGPKKKCYEWMRRFKDNQLEIQIFKNVIYPERYRSGQNA